MVMLLFSLLIIQISFRLTITVDVDVVLFIFVVVDVGDGVIRSHHMFLNICELLRKRFVSVSCVTNLLLCELFSNLPVELSVPSTPFSTDLSQVCKASADS